MSLVEVRKQLRRQGNKKKAAILQRFFTVQDRVKVGRLLENSVPGSKKVMSEASNFLETGPGQYAQGDIFLGVSVPETRRVANSNQSLRLQEITQLLKSKIHEERLLSLLILISKYNKANDGEKERIYKLYINHTKYINNWDLVDLSAHYIVGDFLMSRSKRPLYLLSKSNLLWDRRISIIATFYFIKNHKFQDALKISKILLNDQHDLIQKAVGWMLREIGKRDSEAEEKFLKKHYRRMPRTMLRYAIERFPESKRQAYLRGKI
ncbi:DNA alkylation repair protein [Thermoproteota archaeon]